MFKRLKLILWWAFMVGVFIYCIWLFFNTVDAYYTQQMNFWNQNLGM